ncbi:hypothetical protein CRUP_011181, partial [Coryphaenoides rupestris]
HDLPAFSFDPLPSGHPAYPEASRSHAHSHLDMKYSSSSSGYQTPRQVCGPYGPYQPSPSESRGYASGCQSESTSPLPQPPGERAGHHGNGAGSDPQVTDALRSSGESVGWRDHITHGSFKRVHRPQAACSTPSDMSGPPTPVHTSSPMCPQEREDEIRTTDILNGDYDPPPPQQNLHHNNPTHPDARPAQAHVADPSPSSPPPQRPEDQRSQVASATAQAEPGNGCGSPADPTTPAPAPNQNQNHCSPTSTAPSTQNHDTNTTTTAVTPPVSVTSDQAAQCQAPGSPTQGASSADTSLESAPSLDSAPSLESAPRDAKSQPVVTQATVHPESPTRGTVPQANGSPAAPPEVPKLDAPAAAPEADAGRVGRPTPHYSHHLVNHHGANGHHYHPGVPAIAPAPAAMPGGYAQPHPGGSYSYANLPHPQANAYPQPPLPEKRRQPSQPGSPESEVAGGTLGRISSSSSSVPQQQQHHVTFSPTVGEIAPSGGQAEAGGAAEAENSSRVSVKFVQDSSRFWYKPSISREQAIGALKEREPGAFLIRDSNSFQGAYGLALKVATPPANISNHSSK